jgi:anti-sigma B factor antagonist
LERTVSEHPFAIGVSDDTLRVSGEIDVAVAAELLDAILSHGTSAERLSMTLDLGGVTFIESTGIGALIEAHKRLDLLGCQMRLANVPRCVSGVTGVLGLDEYLGVAADDGATGEMAL